MADTAVFVVKLKDLYSRPAKRMKQSTDRFNRSAKRSSLLTMDMSSAMGRLGPVMGAIKWGAAAAGAASMAASFLTFRRVMESERITKMLDTITGDGVKSFREMQGMAINLGLDVDETARAFAKFNALKLGEEKSRNMIRLGADLQTLGATTNEINGAFRAIGQVIATGTLQGDELNELANNVSAIGRQQLMENIGKLMGTDLAGAMKAKEQGKVSAQTFLQAFEMTVLQQVGKSKAGQAAEDFVATTMPGALNKAQAQFKTFWIRLADQAKPGLAAGLNAASETFGAFAKTPKGFAFFKNMGDIMSSFGDTIGMLAPLVVEFSTELLGGLMEGFNAVTGATAEAGFNNKSWVDILRATIPVLATIGQAVGGAAGFVVRFAQAVSIGGAMVTAGIVSMFELVSDVSYKMWDLGFNIVSGLWDGIKSSWGWMIQKFDGLVQLLPQGVKSALGIASPSKEMKKLGEHTGDGFQIGLERSMPSDISPRLNGGRTEVGAPRIASINVSAPITVDGSGGATETANMIQMMFEQNLGAVLSRYANEVGA